MIVKILQETYNKIIKETLDGNEIKNLMGFINTGEPENIDLALDISKSQGFDLIGYIRDRFGLLYQREFNDKGILYDEQIYIQYYLLIYKTSRLDLSDMSLDYVPEGIKDLPNLIRLALSNNNLIILPQFLSQMNLKELRLSNNQLTELPDLSNVSNKITIDGNPNLQIPEWLFNIQHRLFLTVHDYQFDDGIIDRLRMNKNIHLFVVDKNGKPLN